MNIFKYIIITGIAFLFVGCPARSLFPLFTDKDTLDNSLLVGAWANQEKNSEKTMTFQKAEKKSYKVFLRDGEDVMTYEARLGQIGKFWFLSSSLSKSGDHHTLSAHIIHRVWIDEDTLKVAALEADWLKEMSDAKKLAVTHVKREGEVILNATTEELQAFVLKYAEDEKAFPKRDVFVRLK